MAKRTTTRHKTTDAEAYAARRNDIARLLDVLHMELDRHAEEAKADPSNWGRAGDLDYVRQSLVTLVAFTSGRETEDVQRFLDGAE